MNTPTPEPSLHANLNAKRATNRQVASVSHAIAILRLLAAGGAPRGVTAIARSLGLSPSSCLNILRTLHHERFVNFDLQRKTYELGQGLVVLARRFSGSLDAFSVLRDEMAAVSTRHAVTSALWRLTSDERFVLVGSVESASVARIGLHTGQRVPLLAGAVGRCVAAYSNLTQRELRERFNAVRWHERPSFRSFMDDAKEVSARGWALDRGQLLSGMTTVSAPILNAQKGVAYCIANVSFRGQLNEAAIQSLGEATRRLVRRCEKILFGTAPG
jgi:DNA-binding IclR family transcriptional regulator